MKMARIKKSNLDFIPLFELECSRRIMHCGS